MKRALLVLALGTPCAHTSLAQTQASLGVGVGTVRFPGGTSFSSATFAPALEYVTEARYGSVAGSLASLPGGAWSLQGRADVWAATRPLLGRVRLGAEGIWAGTTRTDGGWTAVAHGIGEALWGNANWGGGIGGGPSGEFPTPTARRGRGARRCAGSSLLSCRSRRAAAAISRIRTRVWTARATSRPACGSGAGAGPPSMRRRAAGRPSLPSGGGIAW